MRSTQLTLLATVVMIAAAAGCGNDAHSAGNTSKATGTSESAAQSASATTAPRGSSTTDANAKKVCSDVSGEIQTTLAKVAEAEAIGPPAGHYAVSAQYSAGAAGISVHTTVDSEAARAAKGVAEAMSAIADKYVDSSSKPDKAPVNTAIDKFKAVCAAGK